MSTGTAYPPRAGRLAWAAVLAIVLAAALVRARVLDAPLERDEGEYAYAGQLLLQGVPPYAEVYNMKLPGIYLAYAAVLAAFGETAGGVHAGLLLVNAAAIVLVFLLARRLADDLTGVLAAFVFAVLTLGQGISGVFANAEHFVLPPALGGLVLLLRAIQRDRLLPLAASGLLLGTAFVVKQHGVFFAVLGGVWLAIDLARRQPFHLARAARRAALFAAACAAPLALTALWLWVAGVFEPFWWWTMEYAPDYIGQVPLAQASRELVSNGALVIGDAPILWMAAALGAAALATPLAAGRRLFAGLFALASVLAICPGFFFRPHYFLLLAPAASLLAAVAVVALARGPWRAARAATGTAAVAVAAVIVLVLAGEAVWRRRRFLFELTPTDITRTSFPYNPFSESVEVAKLVALNAGPDERVAVFGSEPQICFYAKRRSATGFIYMYPLMEAHPYARTLQQQMIAEVEAADPAVVVYVDVPGSWLGDPGAHPVLRACLEGLTERFDVIARMPVSGHGLPPAEGADKLSLIVLRRKP